MDGDAPSLSLRFHNLPNQDIGGVFDGGDENDKDLLAKLTRKTAGYVPPIPKGAIDKNNGELLDPSWESVLTKRERPMLILRLLTLNCLCHSGFTRTRAQWLWCFNLFCASVHTAFTVVVLRKGHEKGSDLMNIDVWALQPVWNDTAGRGNYDVTLVDNGHPIRIDYLVGAFFAISALAHWMVVLVSPFDCFIWAYWKWVDLGFGWWRWLEYSFSAGIMMIGICLITGLREQNTLALVFMLIWVTCVLGALTELWSRPHREYGPNDDGRYDVTRWQGDIRDVKPGVQWSELKNADEKCHRMHFIQRRRTNYILRMLPHIIGWFPYIAAWWVVLSGFYEQLDHLRREDEDLFDKVPRFVPWAVFSTAAIFSTFAIPQIVLQWHAPKHYYRAEFWYCLLSLTSKVVLGGLLYSYVIMAKNGAAALTLRKEDVLNATVLNATVS